MKPTILCASVAITLTWIALAQGTEDAMTQLRACSLMESAHRTECLDKLSRTLALATPLALREDHWIISQTRSPLDYSPIATATVLSREIEGSDVVQLSIRCRERRTEIVVTGPGITGHGDDYAISYRVNAGEPRQVATATPAFGNGIAFKTDTIALIQSLPGDGEFVLHFSTGVGPPQDAMFSLTGLERVRTKIAAPCGWPHTIAKPNTDDR